MTAPIDSVPGGIPLRPPLQDTDQSERSDAAQAHQVFLQGCGLPAAWSHQPGWCILEIGFGQGLNFLLTWAAWRADPLRPRSLHVVSLDANRAIADEVGLLAKSHPELHDLAVTLSQQFKGLLPGVHRLAFEDGQVLLTLCIGDTKGLLKDQRLVADSVFLGGSNAAHNPDICDVHTLKAVARCCRRGTQLTAPGAALSTLDKLKQCGFDVQPSLGTAPELTALQARFDPVWVPKNQGFATRITPGHCLVIGAGLAGAATASSLARRGWRVTVLDAGPGAAAGASGLPVGLLAPHTSPDDSSLSRLSRSGLRATWQAAAKYLTEGRDYAMTGVLQRRLDGQGSAGALPADWPIAGQHWSQDATAEQLAQVQSGDKSPALWHGAGGWIRPAQLVKALLTQPGIQLKLNARIAKLEQQADGWLALDGQSQALARADMVVLATGVDCVALAQPWSPDLPLQPIRGQVSWGMSEGAVLPPFPVHGHGSFVPAFPTDGPGRLGWLLGATFERDRTHTELREDDQLSNLARLQTLLPNTASSLRERFENREVKAWAGVRCASPDRLPLVGPLDQVQAPGLWVCTALGSRGLTFAVLCAELLAAWLNAEPLPLDPRLARALRADRFAARTSGAR